MVFLRLVWLRFFVKRLKHQHLIFKESCEYHEFKQILKILGK